MLGCSVSPSLVDLENASRSCTTPSHLLKLSDQANRRFVVKFLDIEGFIHFYTTAAQFTPSTIFHSNRHRGCDVSGAPFVHPLHTHLCTPSQDHMYLGVSPPLWSLSLAHVTCSPSCIPLWDMMWWDTTRLRCLLKKKWFKPHGALFRKVYRTSHLCVVALSLLVDKKTLRNPH